MISVPSVFITVSMSICKLFKMFLMFTNVLLCLIMETYEVNVFIDDCLEVQDSFINKNKQTKYCCSPLTYGLKTYPLYSGWIFVLGTNKLLIVSIFSYLIKYVYFILIELALVTHKPRAASAYAVGTVKTAGNSAATKSLFFIFSFLNVNNKFLECANFNVFVKYRCIFLVNTNLYP